MDKGIVDGLWLEANKVRGAMDLSDACRIIVYALFIKYIEMRNGREALSSYDEKYSASYLALIYGKIVGPETVGDYIKAVEKDIMPDVGESIISAEMEKLLEKAETDHVQKIFSIIAEAGFRETSQLYVAAASLLDRLSHAYGNADGRIPPNLSLCRLEGRLLNCQDGMRVYDGFCGYGLSLSEAAGGRGTVFMQDIDRSAAAISTVMALLKGNRIGAVGCGDSQLNPLPYEKYDRIVCEPPFGRKYDNNYLSSVPEDNCIYPEISDGGSLALRHLVAHLGENGIAVVLVPTGMLFKSGKGAGVRERLAKEYIDAVLELPSGVVPNTWTATALLVIKKNKEDDSIFMLNAKDFFEKPDKKHLTIDEDSISKIIELYEERGTVEGVSCSVSGKDVEDREYNLCTSQYVISNLKDTIMLGDTEEYLKKYGQLSGQLAAIDKKLETVRGRFIGKA